MPIPEDNAIGTKALESAPIPAASELAGPAPSGRGAVRDGEQKYSLGALVGMTPPYQDEEVEESILLTLLIGVEPENPLHAEYQRQREWIYSHLEPEHLHYLNPYRIYSACRALHEAGAPVTLVSLQGAFVEAGYSQSVRDDLMASVARAARSMSDGEALEGEHWARSVIRYSAMRAAAHEASATVAQICQTGRIGGGELIDGAIRRLQEIRGRIPGTAVSGALSDGDGAAGVYARLERSALRQEDVIPTGFRGLDRMLDRGVRRGDYIGIGGRPGTGKSSLAFGIAWRMAMAGRRVLYASLEMPKAQLERRLLSMASGVGLSRLRNPDVLTDAEWGRVYDASPLVSVPMHIEDGSGLTAAALEAKVRELKESRGLDAVFVDYLQLMQADGRAYSRENEVATLSGAMKRIAKQYEVPVFVLTQLNRNVESRDVGAPQLSDIRESDAMANDADVVIFLERDMQAAFSASRRGVTDSITTAVIAKNRAGNVGAVRLLYRGACTMYVDLGLCMHAGARDEGPAWSACETA